MTEADKQRLIKILSNWDNLRTEFDKRGITRNDVLNDNFIQWAVTTPLYNIGEHVNNLSHEFAEQHTDIPWSKIAGLRHRLVHNYEGTNWSIIVEVIYTDIPNFIRQIKDILNQDS